MVFLRVYEKLWVLYFCVGSGMIYFFDLFLMFGFNIIFVDLFWGFVNWFEKGEDWNVN